MTTKNPTYLKPLPGLTYTQRKSLGLGKPCAPRVRQAGEATSVTICNASTSEFYRTGYGEVAQPIRQGSLRAHGIASRGVRT